MTGHGTDREHGDEPPRTQPSSWQDWQRWVQDVDWSDWRSWLRRVASTDWAAGPWPGAPWDPAPQAGWDQAAGAGALSLTLRAFGEDEPGDGIGEHLTAVWPAFREWWREGAARPTAGQ